MQVRLVRVSDRSGKLEEAEVAVGRCLAKGQLESADVFVVDNGADVFVWTGKGAAFSHSSLPVDSSSSAIVIMKSSSL